MTEQELDRVVAALRSGKSFSIYGADGEWGFEPLPSGLFRSWAHDPGADVPDREVTEDEVRRDLRPFSYEQVASRLR